MRSLDCFVTSIRCGQILRIALRKLRSGSKLVGTASLVFNSELIELLDSIRRDKEQTIDHDNLDTVLRAEWEGDAEDNGKQVAKDFREYLESHRDQIEALTIFYSQPHRRAELTYNPRPVAQPSLCSEDTEGNALPVSGDAERPLSDTRRPITGCSEG
jgi:type I site-specific restriction endonuclease